MRTIKQQKNSSARGGKATIYDVASASGVSPSTVSRVISGNASISAEVCHKVAFASRKVGFVPKQRMRMVGLFVGVSELNGPIAQGYADNLLAMAAREFHRYNFVTELLDLSSFNYSQAMCLDAVISAVTTDDLQKLTGLPNLPVITINRPMLEEGIHSYCTDHRQGAYIATEHLLKNGHRRITFVENWARNWGAQERLSGYKEALAGAGVEFNQDLVFYSRELPLHEIVARMRRQKVSAVVNLSEEIAMDFPHYLRNVLNLELPRELSVISIENSTGQQYMSPPQTVVRQPFDLLLERLARDLDELLSSKDTSDSEGKEDSSYKDAETYNVVLPCELIERDSVTAFQGAY